LASRDKQKVRGKVLGYILNLGEFFKRANLYIMILVSYDITIDMDWLELHEVILNSKMKQLSLVDDEGKICMIVGWNQGVTSRFIYSFQLWKSMHKGCKLYAILALNEKGVAEVLENFLVV
jgi:hypothetical protein